LVAYPHLSSEQQQGLPELIQTRSLPAMYEDSTHQLWQCDTSQGSLILKICNSDNVDKSTFWQGMAYLFDVELPKQLGEFDKVYNKVNSLSPLKIPDYIASGSMRENQDLSAFILTLMVSGTMVEASWVNDSMVKALAQHIGQMHQCQQPTWGALCNAELTASQWPERLQHALKLLAAKQHVISEDILVEALKLAANCTTDYFVPIMPDLRWDQFLQQNSHLSALVDLDAFVFAPRELEFVLLEYLLDEQQAILFAEQYKKKHSLPTLSQVRKPYRLLLFMMNVLGEKDVDIWMRSPIRF